MSYDSFQRAISYFIASPSRCLELRKDASAACKFELTAIEHKRLLAMVNHRGMSHNCSLYRANRLTPIGTYLPKTVENLGPDLLKELEMFWLSVEDVELQFKMESERFAYWLLVRIEQGHIKNQPLKEIIYNELQLLDTNMRHEDASPSNEGGARGEFPKRDQ